MDRLKFNTMWPLGALAFGLSIYWFLEYESLRRARRQIKVRIHVNGTRGKSSTTRLIAGALRGGGIRVLAKVTGTEPRWIYEDGSEVLVPRRGRANIIEQMSVIKAAKNRGAQALVLECMALRPELQEAEHKIVSPTIGVITNARADHLDVMGPTVYDVALALSSTIPKGGLFFTSDHNFFPLWKKIAKKRGTRALLVDPKEVKKSDLDRFSYIEHPENVAIALAIAKELGISREDAMEGMIRATPDVGALRTFALKEKNLLFINAFAANDPDSIKFIWERVKNMREKKVVVMNCRKDRVQRSIQLGELLAKYFYVDDVFVTGELTRPFIGTAIKKGFDPRKLHNLEGLEPSEALDRIITDSPEGALVYLMGNIVTYGERLVEKLKERAGVTG